MLILLPPSEGKSAPCAGPALDIKALSFPELETTRRRVLAAVTDLCRENPKDAVGILGLGPTQHPEVAVNALLDHAPCRPAIEVYSGVLFAALDYPTLTKRARARARAQLVIASALWGLVRPMDPIPNYRLSSSVTLPGIGTMTGVWKEPLSEVLGATSGLIIDLRSGGYVALGPVPAEAGERTVTMRVLQERGGRRFVVSHHNKATKGRIVRALLEAPRQPRTPTAMIAALGEAGFHAEAGRPSRTGHPIDVVVEEPSGLSLS